MVELIQIEEGTSMTQRDIIIKDQLLESGIPPSIYGFEYLTTAISLYTCDIRLTGPDGLYEAVAKKHNTTASKVERAIRHALSLSYVAGVSNGVFIATWRYKLARAEVLAQ